MCVCVSLHTYICVCVCVHVGVCTCVCVYVCVPQEGLEPEDVRGTRERHTLPMLSGDGGGGGAGLLAVILRPAVGSGVTACV